MFALKITLVLISITYSPIMALNEMELDGSGSGSGSGSGDSTPYCSAEQILSLSSLPEAIDCMVFSGRNGLEDLFFGTDAISQKLCFYKACQDLVTKLGTISLPSCDWKINDQVVKWSDILPTAKEKCLRNPIIYNNAKAICTVAQRETLKGLLSTSLMACTKHIKIFWSPTEEAICQADECGKIDLADTAIPDCIFSFYQGVQGDDDFEEYIRFDFKDFANSLIHRCADLKKIEPTDEPTTEAPTDETTTEVPTEEPTTEAPTDEPTTEAPTDAPTPVPSGSSTLLFGSFLTAVCMLAVALTTV